MRTVEIVGYKRNSLTKADTIKLRTEGNVPCVLYGKNDHVHFYAPAILFRPLVYTPDISFVNLNIEGSEYKCILQDSQFHPVSEMLLHADFLVLEENKPIKMHVPTRFHGSAPGMLKGGKLMVKLRTLLIKALPADMPEFIDIDISHLELGKSVKVGEIELKNFEILNSPLVSIASVSIPRAAKLGELEDAAAAEAAATAAAAEGAEDKTEKGEKTEKGAKGEKGDKAEKPGKEK